MHSKRYVEDQTDYTTAHINEAKTGLNKIEEYSTLAWKNCEPYRDKGWLESYEGSLAIGPNDKFGICLYRLVKVQSSKLELKFSFIVTEQEYKGKKAYKITYDKSLYKSVIFKPDFEKYLVGADNLFVVKQFRKKL